MPKMSSAIRVCVLPWRFYWSCEMRSSSASPPDAALARRHFHETGTSREYILLASCFYNGINLLLVTFLQSFMPKKTYNRLTTMILKACLLIMFNYFHSPFIWKPVLSVAWMDISYRENANILSFYFTLMLLDKITDCLSDGIFDS